MGTKEIKRKYKHFALLVAIFFFGVVVSRPIYAQITEADPYTNIDWKAIKSNTALKFWAGNNYPGEAYWYSGNDTILRFKEKIDSGEYIPGGYKDTANATDRAGIDCSGFIGRIWGFGDEKVGTVTLPNYSRKITKANLQRNDILNSYAEHVIIFDQWDTDPNYLWIYHAKGEGNPNDVDDPGNMVVREKAPWSKYSYYLPRRRGLTAPISCNISNGATGVSRRPTIVVQFNGGLQASSVNSSSVILRKSSSYTPVSGTVSYNASNYTVTFTPSVDLDEDAEYRFIITDAVMDNENRPIDGDNNLSFGPDYTFVFRTRPSLIAKFFKLANWAWNDGGSSSGLSVSAQGVQTMSSGNGNGIIDPEETIELALTLTNTGTQSVTGVTGTLSSANNVTISDNTKSFGDLAVGASASNSSKFVFSVPSGYIGNEINFELTISGWMGSELSSDKINFKLPVGTQMIAPPGASVSEISNFGFFGVYRIDDNWDSDSHGNGNEVLDFEDGDVNLIFYAGNSSSSPISAQFDLNIDTWRMTLNESKTKYLTIPPWSYIEVPYNVMRRTYYSAPIATNISMKVNSNTKYLSLYIPINDEEPMELKSYSPNDVFSPNGDGTRDCLDINFRPLNNFSDRTSYDESYISSYSLDILVREKYGENNYDSWKSVSGVSGNISGFKKSKSDGYWAKWDGSGAGSGCYQFKVVVTAYYGSSSKCIWHTPPREIYLHESSPKAEQLALDPPIIGINPSKKGSSAVSFNLTDAADISISMKNKNGDLLKNIASESLSFQGRKEYSFDTYNSSGSILPDGKYNIEINLNDRANTPNSYVREATIDHAPQDFYLITSTTEVLSPTKTYALSWTPATPYGPDWNHLKKYQVLAYRVGGGAEDYGVIKNDISPNTTSINIDLGVDGIWKIKIRAVDEEGNWCDSDGTNSAGFAGDPNRLLTIVADSTPPGPITLNAPYDGQYFDGRDVRIAWHHMGDVNFSHYELCIGTDQDDMHGSAVYSATFEANVTSCEVELPGGIYYIYLAAYDKAGHYRRLDGKTDISDYDQEPGTLYAGKWPLFEIDHEPPAIAYNPYNFPPPVTERYFSPNGDGKRDTAIINYSVNDESYWRVNHLRQNEVLIEVRGELIKDGQVVRSWTNRSPPGWQQVIWDGTNDRGNRVEDGVYTIKITATDKAQNASANESQWVVVDTTPPEIRNIASSGIFSPNSDGEFDADNLTFDLTDNLSPSLINTIEVVDNSDRLIARLGEGRGPSTVPCSLSTAWDGLTLSGWVAPDNTYKYLISAEDLAGNSAVSDSTLVTVDTTPPQIVDLTSAISKLSFTESSGSLDLRFRILESSGRANVFASILDARGGIVQNYPITCEADRQYQISWNGRDSFGFFVPDHSYVYYRFYATDCVANRRYSDNDQLIRVETPYTGVYGNVIYSPDGEVKIIIPQGAVSEEAELSIEMRDTPPRSYRVAENDNITLTYEFLPEGLIFNKPCTLMFHYNPGVLNFPDQPVLPYQYSTTDGWKQLAGNIRNNVFNSFIDKTGTLVMGADLTPPPTPIVNPPPSPTGSDLITVSGTAEHDSIVNLNVNGTLYTKLVRSPDWSISNVNLAEGENLISATARDSAGNTSSPSAVLSAFKDTTPPLLSRLNDEILYASPAAHFSASASDAGCPTCEVWLIIQSPAGRQILQEKRDNNLEYDWSSSGQAEGAYPYNIQAVDGLDNFSQRSGSVIVDKTAPYALLELLPLNYYLSGNLEIWGSVEDQNFSSWIIDYGTGVSPSSFTEIARGYASRGYGLMANFDTHLLPSGIYTFRLTAYDRAGNNKSILKSKHIINSPIMAHVFSPAVNEHIREVKNIQGSISIVPSEFSCYYLEYGVGFAPSSWTIIYESSTLPTTPDLGSWNTRALSDGSYALRLRAVNLGGENFIFEVPVTIDNTDPVTAITYPTSIEVLGGVISISGTAADENFANYKVEYGEGINPLSWNEVITSPNLVSSGTLASWISGSLNGTHSIRVTAFDKAGNSTSSQVSLTVDNYIDASLDYPSTGMVLADTITIRGTAADINFREYYLEYGRGSNPLTFTRIGEINHTQVTADVLGSWDTRTVADGTYTLRLVVHDQANNEIIKSAVIIVDNTYPTVSISDPRVGDYLAGVVNIAGTAYDDNIQSSLLEYQDNSVPGTWHNIYSSAEAQNIQNDTIFNWNAGSFNGSHTIRVSVTDKTGKTSRAEVSVILDNIRPMISITSPSRESVNTGALEIVGEISDINLKNYLIKYGAGIEPTQFWELKSSASSQVGTLYTWQTTNVKDGYYTLRYEAEDKAGNKSSYEFPIIIDNAPAIAEIQEPIANQVVRGTIDIKGIACDADFTTYNFKRYEILYGQGSLPASWTTLESLAVPKINETLTSWNTVGLTDGTYSLKLRSQDISGITEKTKTLIVDNSLPTLALTAPTDGATLSGNYAVRGTATDVNFREYKIYYQQTGAADWNELNSGSSPVNNSTFFSWNTILLGDGIYRIKLWAKDQAGNESEIIRNVTINNVLDVNNVSLSAGTFSPNGDGLDDRVRLKYNLTENSNVTVKVYRKSSLYTYNWAAFASGTRYPSQDFNYTLSASGVNYPARDFGWRVDANGVENYSVSRSGSITGNDFGNLYTGPPWISFNYRWIDGEKRAVLANGEYHPLRNDVGDEVIAATYIAVYRQWIGANINYGDTFLDVPTPSITVSGDKIRKFNYGSYLEIYDKTGSGSKTRFYMLKEIYDGAGDLVTNGWIVNPSEATFSWSVTGNKSQSVSASDPSSGSKTATKYYNGSISGNSYSVTLSPQYGGTISGKTISYTQTSGSGVSTSRDGSGWIGNTCSGVINADYTYSGNSWTNSTSPNKSVSALEGNKTVSETVASIFGAVGGEPYHTYSSISVSAPSDPDVNLRFNYSGTNSTSRTDDYLIASTPVSQSWTTANHTGGVVGPDGWIRYGPNPLPFYYNEAPESKNVRTITGYAPPSDVIISSWAVNPDNLYATIYGTNANGDFNVRLSDSMLVKTIQYDTLTTAGEHTIEWDGTDNTGSSVGNGDYIFVIYAGGNVVKKGINGEYPVTVQKSAEITASSISETYISPNGDGLKDNANINYTLSQNASSVNIEIRDKDNNVTKMISGPATAGTHYVIWDGSTSAPGISAQDGIYTAKIIVTHSSGAVREKTLTITVDNNNPGISEEEPKVIVYSAAFEENPVYSPDKTKIAYAKEISGKKQICSMDLSTSQVTQLTDQDENKEPSWSPDGSSLGFISNRSGNWDLYKMNTDGSKVKQITANSAAENVPAWSPDGTKLAFGSDRQGHLLLPKWNIWTLNRDGTNPSQVTQDETTFRDETPSWSPDGKKLIYASDQDGNFDIWMVNADSSGKTKITSSSEAETRPAWSPDGLKIAYKNERGLSIYDVRSKAQVQLITAEGLTNPSWSRDGTEIIYNDSAGNIYSKSTYKGGLTGVITYPILSQTLSGLVEIKGTALDTNLEGYKVECSPNITPYIWTEIGSSNVPKKDSILAVWNTAPLSDGQYILKLTAWDRAGNSLENSLIVNSDNDNWKLTIASLTQITTDDAWDIEPAWSPDGSKLAFSSNRSGNYDIWAMNADGSGLINLANNPAYDGKPAWSPNGSKIAFVSDRSGNKDIWTMNIDGSDLKQLTSLTIIDTDPCWSPDSTRIAFASNRSDNYDIWVVNADGSGEPIKIMSSEAYEGEPSWSRAGLAFTSDRSGHKEIWMLNADGTGEAFRLTNNPAESQEPCWSPFAIPLSDGSSRPLITFTSTRQDNSDIYLMDTDGIDQSKSLTDYTNTDCNPAWSPDGGKVAFASFKDNQYDIWVMNFAINTSILSIPTIQQTATLEIISPKDGVKITNLRPTFKWYGIQGHTSYRIVARKDIEVWTQPKNITQTEASPESGARPAIAYPIHEFDYGLNRGIWNWKIQALNSDNSVLAETAEETFEIDPPFTISGITNYPNPFDPNRERTKIRYKLSNEADEVRIRIYDIAGALVNELDGYTNGEGTNIWFKYNDVEWNGRNGRGDLVLNGIYPFEVVARSGGTSVSGRGKIAILK